MINAMLQQLESMGKAVRIQENLTAASLAVVKAARKEKPVSRVVGAALTLLHRLFWKARYRLHPGFFACGFP